ncbi:hypothetical protein [Burkholderia sp. Ac-20344]|uniref:hypothetical protein n=1 Tax=Burkholderia sp. Ac-20344 TaxID=2703890 RepID=UPI00197B6162|nr:hypothetical protein [Burkholderia sp. Ac-20344]MBN3836831.1 hypothetical protein [Burkholderia sp. Ac-20344]
MGDPGEISDVTNDGARVSNEAVTPVARIIAEDCCESRGLLRWEMMERWPVKVMPRVDRDGETVPGCRCNFNAGGFD